ncbi:MAG: mannose-1-phosphate guanylyltransferase/mannose-6-phosphate isomerase [Gammaproteobacteria bacterium]|nr:mannose-1-phosphate guanylyltransferase/mannose-6-phosphate isomerase [Gammaproteobacteria bacterium]
MLVPVILSGGAGSRLWPLSRELYPKQLLPLVGDRTLLQQTVARIADLPSAAPPMVVCNGEHRFMVAEQLRGLGVEPGAILLEPVGRNTAPAVAVAALEALVSGGEEPLLLVLPADHVIRDVNAFHAAVDTARKLAGQDRLVTFGIVPTGPETGFGYIARGEPLAEVAEDAYAVERFVEKPDRETAERFVAGGDHYWNSGMFLFRARRYLEALGRHQPEMLAACRDAHAGREADYDFLRLDAEAFTRCPANSIDYAVMEPACRPDAPDAAAMVPLDAGWSDVGSWSSLWDEGTKDGDGNVCIGDVVTTGVERSYLRAEDRLLAVVGVEDHVVIETADAVLVAHKDRVQEVKGIVERLKADGREEAGSHRTVYRPWGSYECLNAADRFQVKRITVRPGAQLSLQMHHHRAEHWVVVAGTARITRGDEVFLLSENESTYIPLGTRHRLENIGKVPLDLIEVQSGSYLGEDDIVRFEDSYGR